jgi:hypothetical protein
MPEEASEQPAAGRDYLADWLSIPPGNRPASLYALCGVEDLTDDIEHIRRQATENIKKLRRFAGHPVHGQAASKLLDTVSKAMLALTDRQRKKTYDQRLRGRKLHAISLLGKKLLDGERERLAEFIDGAYAAAGNYPLREIEAAIVETYRRYRGRRFTFGRLALYLRSPAWHTEAHLLARVDQKVFERQKAGEVFRDRRREVMADGLKLGLSPAQALAVWANRVQYEIALEKQLRAWGLGPDGQPLVRRQRLRVGLLPWVMVANATVGFILFLIAVIVSGTRKPAVKAGPPREPAAPEPVSARTYVHPARVLTGPRFGMLATPLEGEPIEARKAAYLRLLYLAAGGDEEIIAVVNALIDRELKVEVRAFAALTLTRPRSGPQVNRLTRALLPLANDLKVGRTVGPWMYRQVFGTAAPAGESPDALLALLFERLNEPVMPPNVVPVSAAGFRDFCKALIRPAADELAGAAELRRLAGTFPSAAKIAELAPVVDGLVRSALIGGPLATTTQKFILAMQLPGAVGRQWLIDELRGEAGFDLAAALRRTFDNSDTDRQRIPAIAAAHYLRMFDKPTARRVLGVLERAAAEPPPTGARLLCHVAIEYLNAASGLNEPIDFNSAVSRMHALKRYTRWLESLTG